MTAAFPAMVNRPSLIEYGKYRFLIMDAPTDANLPAYIDILKKKHAVALVRACEPTYRVDPVKAAGIRVLDLPFDDGDPPPEHMLTQWLQLVHDEFGAADAGKPERAASEKPLQHPPHHSSTAAVLSPPSAPSASASSSTHAHIDMAHSESKESLNKKTIGVHCVAGLGRAPVLVAVALIEAGLQPFEAIAFIRKKRRGAINARQLKYLEGYKPRKKNRDGGSCVVC